jgi:Rrf2 family protein
MRISTKGSYAIEAMLAIALSSADRSVSIREISERTGISDKYLEQIFLLLKEAGLLVGTRGVGGGYILSRPAEEINIGQILRATETSFSPVPCVSDPDTCDRLEHCASRVVWTGLDQTIAARVDPLTLRMLADDYLRSREKASDDFSI